MQLKLKRPYRSWLSSPLMRANSPLPFWRRLATSRLPSSGCVLAIATSPMWPVGFCSATMCKWPLVCRARSAKLWPCCGAAPRQAKPSEWFLVPLEVIDEVVGRVGDKNPHSIPVPVLVHHSKPFHTRGGGHEGDEVGWGELELVVIFLLHIFPWTVCERSRPD